MKGIRIFNNPAYLAFILLPGIGYRGDQNGVPTLLHAICEAFYPVSNLLLSDNFAPIDFHPNLLV
jgi:hypothetical protein